MEKQAKKWCNHDKHPDLDLRYNILLRVVKCVMDKTTVTCDILRKNNFFASKYDPFAKLIHIQTGRQKCDSIKFIESRSNTN